MKQVGILTFHCANNFGALLQAVSLQRTIISRENGDCELIDYRPEFIRKDYSPSPFKSMRPKEILSGTLRIPDKVRRNLKFNDFRKKYTICTKAARSEKAFRQECNRFDRIIVGSDQVWNYRLTEQDLRYFLPNLDKHVRKLAYGASIGDADFSGEQAKEMLQYLRDFQSISVRESSSGMVLAQALGREDIACVLDPVFLTPRDAWLNLAAQSSQKQDYILFFKMGYSKTADPALEFARRMSRETGCRLYMLWDQETWFKYRDVRHVGAVGPAEFLQWVRDARCVITNSFHAAAFSIILNIPFYVETEIERKDRILNILELFGLEDRGLCRGCLQSNADSGIDWDRVNTRLDAERQKSLEYLDTLLK